MHVCSRANEINLKVVQLSYAFFFRFKCVRDKKMCLKTLDSHISSRLWRTTVTFTWKFWILSVTCVHCTYGATDTLISILLLQPTSTKNAVCKVRKKNTDIKSHSSRLVLSALWTGQYERILCQPLRKWRDNRWINAHNAKHENIVNGKFTRTIFCWWL